MKLAIRNGAKLPREIMLVENARRDLAEARTIDKVKEIRDKAEALRLYAKQQADGLEAQNCAAEIKIWAERRGGEILSEMRKSGERHGQGKMPKQNYHDGNSKTLADLGINGNQSSRWQTVATVPEKKLERHIEETKAAGKELTTAGVLNEAKKLRPQPQLDRAHEHEKKVDIFLKAMERLLNHISKTNSCGLDVITKGWSRKGIASALDSLRDVRSEVDTWIAFLEGKNR